MCVCAALARNDAGNQNRQSSSSSSSNLGATLCQPPHTRIGSHTAYYRLRARGVRPLERCGWVGVCVCVSGAYIVSMLLNRKTQ